jgi:hypothetical protein
LDEQPQPQEQHLACRNGKAIRVPQHREPERATKALDITKHHGVPIVTMGIKQKKEPREQIKLLMPTTMAKKIDQMASKQTRTRANMVLALVSRALDEQERATG